MMHDRRQHDWTNDHEKTLGFLGIESARLGDAVLNSGLMSAEDASKNSSRAAGAAHHPAKSSEDSAESTRTTEHSAESAEHAASLISRGLGCFECLRTL